MSLNRASTSSRFLDAYADHGINFWTITGGNEVMEPYFIGASFTLGTLALPVNHRYWLKEYLSPRLRASNHSQVQFAPLDDMRCYAKYWMTTVMIQAGWRLNE